MTFKIKKKVKIRVTNIEGKPMQYDEYYLIYRTLFFGLFKLYLNFSSYETGGICPSVCNANIVLVNYCASHDAKMFDTKHEALAVITDIEHRPDKYLIKVPH